MAAEGEEGGEPPAGRVAPFGQCVVEMVESDVVVHSPGITGPLFQAEVCVSCYPLVARGEQITLHVCEIDVSAVEEISFVSCPL